MCTKPTALSACHMNSPDEGDDGRNNGIRIRGLTCKYAGANRTALANVSLDISRGEIVGLIGPNGAGKTTLFHCLLGFTRGSAGSIEIDGCAPDSLAAHSKIGYMPERLCYNKNLTALQFLSLHHGLTGRPATSRHDDVERLLNMVELPKAAWRRQLRKFSRGMLQRVGIACALIGDPDYLFLDEPSSGLDPLGVKMFVDLMKRLSRQGTTIILNSHQLDQIERTCSRVVFIKNGSVLKIVDGQTSETLIQMFEECGAC